MLARVSLDRLCDPNFVQCNFSLGRNNLRRLPQRPARPRRLFQSWRHKSGSLPHPAREAPSIFKSWSHPERSRGGEAGGAQSKDPGGGCLRLGGWNHCQSHRYQLKSWSHRGRSVGGEARVAESKDLGGGSLRLGGWSHCQSHQYQRLICHRDRVIWHSKLLIYGSQQPISSY